MTKDVGSSVKYGKEISTMLCGTYYDENGITLSGLVVM